jgi:hypothetical protein
MRKPCFLNGGKVLCGVVFVNLGTIEETRKWRKNYLEAVSFS